MPCPGFIISDFSTPLASDCCRSPGSAVPSLRLEEHHRWPCRLDLTVPGRRFFLLCRIKFTHLLAIHLSPAEKFALEPIEQRALPFQCLRCALVGGPAVSPPRHSRPPWAWTPDPQRKTACRRATCFTGPLCATPSRSLLRAVPCRHSKYFSRQKLA